MKWKKGIGIFGTQKVNDFLINRPPQSGKTAPQFILNELIHAVKLKLKRSNRDSDETSHLKPTNTTEDRVITKRIKIPRDRDKCPIFGAADPEVNITSVAVTLKQWWRHVGLCPKAARNPVLGQRKPHCYRWVRRPKPMGHSLSMCKLQQCHKKSKCTVW